MAAKNLEQRFLDHSDHNLCSDMLYRVVPFPFVGVVIIQLWKNTVSLLMSQLSPKNLAGRKIKYNGASRKFIVFVLEITKICGAMPTSKLV
jgi:hypothetical protein